MVSLKIRRLLAGSAAVAALAASVAVAGPAYAYPTPAGATTGSCSPAAQDAVAVGSTANGVTCTFRFTDHAGTPVTGAHTFAYSRTGYQSDNGHGTTSPDGTATVTVAGISCDAPGTKSETVAVTLDDASANTSGQAFSTVTCVKRTATVTTVTCTARSASPFAGYAQSTCSWTTNAPEGTDVSFVAHGKNAFTMGGDEQVPAGGTFSTTVHVPSASVGVTVTGAVTSSATTEGNSATQAVPNS